MAFYFVSTFAIAQTPTKQPGTLAKDFIGNEVLLKEAFLSGFSSELFKQLGLSAKVRLADNVSPFWQANVERIGSQLDPDTRTLGVIRVFMSGRRANQGIADYNQSR
jgi:hypothetical protein